VQDDPVTQPLDASPFVDLDRPAWSRLRDQTPLPLTAAELEAVRGLGDEVNLDEVRDVYLPLSRLLNLHTRAIGLLHQASKSFLGAFPERTPYVIGIAGSVAVGKSTTARLLRLLLARWPDHPDVALVTTDGFSCPTPNWSAGDCWTARASPSPTTGGRCCASSPRSSPASPRSVRRSTPT
jgi:type I pantothenate kinase